MSWYEWFSLAGICALGAMSPGPSLLIIARCAAAGARQGLAASVAHGAAIAVYAGLTAFGLAVLITRSPTLFSALQWAGAAMLVYLGWKSLRAPAPDAETPQPVEPITVPQAAMQGFGVAFFNPKVAVFFTALFSQFVSVEQSLVTKLGMAGLASAIDAIWYVLVTALICFGRARRWSNPSLSHRLQQLFGVLLIGLAARLVASI